MKAIIPSLEEKSTKAMYLQLYEYIKTGILAGEISYGEKLPSIRNLARNLKISVTTVGMAYSQLLVEGYVYSKPQSGYYVSDISFIDMVDAGKTKSIEKIKRQGIDLFPIDIKIKDKSSQTLYDLSCFDFNKWKKCMNKVLVEYPQMLMFESNPQGEPALRYEISKYVYRERGVRCKPEQIVIAAGTQQITAHLCSVLSKLGIDHVTVEEPGYLPVKNMFRDRGFALSSVKVGNKGLEIDRLPVNIKSAVYVSPSNQFPTGTVMPIAERYKLLDWAVKNGSIIIEDDYDSELRYFGKPVPALQGLDEQGHVVYLGAFSSTLLASIRISYMVLPEDLAEIFRSTMAGYTQTCSKSEQLTLALFMEQGFYATHIKKLRSLYSQKLQKVIAALGNYGEGKIVASNTKSGINIIISVKSEKTESELREQAGAIGLTALPVSGISDEKSEIESKMKKLVFYYNQIPLGDIDRVVKELVEAWKK